MVELLKSITSALEAAAIEPEEGSVLPECVLFPELDLGDLDTDDYVKGSRPEQSRVFAEQRAQMGQEFGFLYLERWLVDVQHRLRQTHDSAERLEAVWDYIEAVGCWASHTAVHGDRRGGCEAFLRAWKVAIRSPRSWALASSLRRLPNLIGPDAPELCLSALLHARDLFGILGDQEAELMTVTGVCSAYRVLGDFEAMLKHATLGAQSFARLPEQVTRRIRDYPVIFAAIQMYAALRLNKLGLAKERAGWVSGEVNVPSALSAEAIIAACFWGEGSIGLARIQYDRVMQDASAIWPDLAAVAAFNWADMETRHGSVTDARAILDRGMALTGVSLRAYLEMVRGTDCSSEDFDAVRKAWSREVGYYEYSPVEKDAKKRVPAAVVSKLNTTPNRRPILE